MSKLNIDDDEELYMFLVNDDEEGKENVGSRRDCGGVGKGKGEEGKAEGR